jgi:hypothetical protein
MGTLGEVNLRKDGWSVKDDMRIKGVSMEMTSDRECEKKIRCAEPT